MTIPQSPEAVQPVAWMWQHDETGMTGFVEHASPEDLAQWERMNRPRKIVSPLYAAPAEVLEVLEKARQALESAAALLERCGPHLQGVEQECCGNYQPDYGGEYMGQREVVPACCMQPIDLSDHVASEMHSLRAALAEIEAMKEKTL